MSDLKDKVKAKIDDAVDATKKAADHVVNKSKDVVHTTGKAMNKGGDRLRDV